MSTTFTMPTKQLTWLITGSSSGFGLSLARIVQAGGHKVIATSRNPSHTPELVDEIKAKGGEWLQLDVDSCDSPKVIDNLEHSGHEIDVLVNNAGYSIHSPVETCSEDEIRAQMESMYFGPVRLIRAILPYMRKRRFGVIANISSGASLEGRETMGPYAGAKGGLDALTKVLAKEVAPYNIRTLTVALGTFNTNMINAALFGEKSIPEDYKGTMSDMMMDYLKNGKVPINGDRDKAMKAVFEVVVGKGVGAGKQAERFLPLGTDMIARVRDVQQYLGHALEVFEDVVGNVGLDK